jgi:hypothetical protein
MKSQETDMNFLRNFFRVLNVVRVIRISEKNAQCSPSDCVDYYSDRSITIIIAACFSFVKNFHEFQFLSTRNLSDITSKFRTIAIFMFFNLQITFHSYM